MLYGTTPPRLGVTPADIERAAEKLVARIEPFGVDGVVIYDVQDESERTSQPRPFPFLPTLDSRLYSRLIHELLGLPIITYKCVGGMDAAQWQDWLGNSQQEFGISTLSLVGSPKQRTNNGSLSLTDAIEITKSHPAGFTLGGVAIAERHSESRSESQRMIQKAQAGCDFFVSQSVYDSHKTIALLNDYARRCREADVAPKRFIFTFAPCGHAKTLDFIKWLGVSVPPAIEERILTSANPLKESIATCRSILSEILDGLEDDNLALGINVESVSNKKDEIDASMDLFCTLRELISEYKPKLSA